MALKAVQMGAQDYLVKSQLLTSAFGTVLLTRSLSYAIERHRMQGVERESAERNARLEMLVETTRSLAHHIRNALAIILGAAERFEGDNLKDAYRLRKAALAQGEIIAATIDALTDVSRTGEIASVEYSSLSSERMLDLEPLIRRHLEIHPEVTR